MNKARRIVQTLALNEVALFSIGLLMLLVLIGTLAQARLGTYAAQKEFFDRWWVTVSVGDARLPLFPGGLTVGALWAASLLAAFITRFRWVRKDAGMLISHAGLLVLLLGQFVTQRLALESQMAIEEGQTLAYSVDHRQAELVLIRDAEAGQSDVTSIPQSFLSQRRPIKVPGTSLRLLVRAYYPNAALHMAQDPAMSLATQGIGAMIRVEPAPPVTSDEDTNAVTAYVDVLDGTKSLGIWLLSSVLGAPQGFTTEGKTWQLGIRPLRRYHPFTLTLKDFTHDVYPGTQIPKNFSSLVHLTDPGRHQDRDVLISMNQPLRYAGRTFYQASFGEGDRLSVLQVVENPAAPMPYIGCAMVLLGLGLQFMSHLLAYRKKKAS